MCGSRVATAYSQPKGLAVNDKTKAANWAIAPARWEGEPRCPYADLAVFLEISKQAIGKRAIKEGWSKNANMSAIVDKAHAAADLKIFDEAAVMTNRSSLVDDQTAIFQHPSTNQVGLPDPKNTTPEVLAKAVETAAVEARSQILAQHRNEWPVVRNQIYKALKGADNELAKLAAAAMKLVQDGERKAWGLDSGGDDRPVRIVIERTEGVRVVR